MKTVDVETTLAHHDPDHCCNQGSLIQLANGELLLGFNEERSPTHADSGQSCVLWLSGSCVARRQSSQSDCERVYRSLSSQL
ncbi:hypothetical protein KFU94_26860 [Chloroflexi bacterium TSY]|nr:hypothetical protein [Chloroflexi bacterium TSY]